RIRGPGVSLNGLTVAFTSGTHSPPHAVSSATSGPSSAATSARAPDCASAQATLSAARATGSSRKAGTICRTVALAKVRGRTWLSSLLTEAIPSARVGLFAARPSLYSMAAGGETRPTQTVRPKSGSPNERSLPEILRRWNRYCGPRYRGPAARGRRARPVLGRGLQVRHEGHQGRGP